jgi:hypothetical protein
LKDLYDIVCVIAGPTTMRSFENLRRTLEDLYVKSTAQGATPEDQAAFNPALIAQAHEAARRDNAKAIVSWAKAIYDELQAEDPINDIKWRLLSARDKERYFARTLEEIKDGRAYPSLTPESRQQQAEATERALREAQNEVSALEHALRDLQESQKAVSGHSSQEGSPGSEPLKYNDLDGDLSPLS